MLSGHYTDAHVFVLFLFFNAMIIKQACGQFSPETYKAVDNLSKDKMMESLDCHLYTPTESDYRNCSTSTLICFAKEVTVLLSEAKKPVDKSQKWLPRRLKIMAHNVHNKAKNCPECEFYSEKPAKVFISTLRNIVQEINNNYKEEGSKTTRMSRQKVRQQ